MKQMTKFKIVQNLGPLLIKCLIGSLKIKFYNKIYLHRIREKYGNVIFAFWHNRMLTLSYAHRGENIYIIISEHTDGEYIARAIHKLGFNSIRGSSTRGGIKALKNAIRISKKNDIAITPDGPRGPKESVREGVIYLSYKTGKPIIPVTCDSKNKWVLNSWDNFIIPIPFSKTRVAYGNAIFVRNKTDIAEKKKCLRKKLIELSRKIEF
ncbi:MAG: lysophospholipid acyltransferase family protein [Candidatus Cloacimonetes bacterium]|nr:lysophospholipid acyltransferase family protein [Candidatus Cloacimonadota bacterium]